VTAHATLYAGRISDIARVLGDPDRQRNDRAIHRCYWNCGCQAVNLNGLCIEDGWSHVPCLVHPNIPGEPAAR
jgi:hypothetical protein